MLKDGKLTAIEKQVILTALNYANKNYKIMYKKLDELILKVKEM